MAEKTTSVKVYTQRPYYDDFDETKNYHRVLFRPGFPVQARELTQMQTALQAQLDRLGQYNFKDGSRVLDGKVTLNVNYDYIKIKSSYNSVDASTILDDLVGSTLTGATVSVKAEVKQVVPEVSGGDKATLYVVYTSNGTDNTTSKFAAEEVLTSDATGLPQVQVETSGNTPIGLGSAVRQEQGVYFIGGTFVYVPATNLILDKYTNTPSYIVGLKITESTATSADDTTLNDNAQGTTNESAPGAHRFKLSTTLIKEPLAIASRTENNYITLMEVEDGKAKKDVTDKTIGTELSERLARRTKEESGDYTVDVFQLNIREHLDDEAGNNGYLTSANGGDTNKIALGVEPGVAYVSGYRVENANTNYVIADKPRGSGALKHEDLEQTSVFVGNYVKVNEALMQGIPDVANYTTVNLYSENITTGQSTVVGTARVRGIENDAASGVKRLFLFDINMTSGAFSSVLSLKDSASGNTDGTDFRADINGTAQLFDTGNNGLVFKLPYSAINSTKSIDDDGNIEATSNMIYTSKLRDTQDSDASGSVDFSAGSHSFADIATSAFIYADVGGSPVTKQIGANTSWYSVSGSTITIDLATAYGASISSPITDVQFVCNVRKTGLSPKVKTKNTNGSIGPSALTTVDGVSNALSLGKADILRVKTIVDATGKDVKDRFDIDNGQRDNYYDLGKVILKQGQSNPGNITVTFDYYTHTGAGDYFSVDSYISDRTNASQTATQYEEIPTFTSGLLGTVQLRDCIDFRPKINDAGTGFTGTGGSAPNPVSNSSIITTDIQYHLPRIDKLVLTKAGGFNVIEGIPSETPQEPETPQDSLELYKIGFSPYVFDINKDIHPFYKDNRRYTMNDIGSLDKRIKNLEYYTSLSLLEQSAADVQLLDGANTRLKNGFIVDSFKNHKIGDTTNIDYKASIDKKNSVLRPKFDERNVNLIEDSGHGGGCVRNKSIVTLPFTESLEISQPYSSFVSNVNPYNVFMWGGQIELSPESDEWKETDVRPSIFIDDSEAYNQFVQMSEEQGILGTVWNEWETNWSGVDVEENSFRGEGGDFRNFFWWEGGGRGNSITTNTVVTTTSHQSRSGINTEVAFDTIQRSDGKKVVEVNFVPFIRSREIFFKAQLMKPNTRVYAFFDGVAVANYVREESSFSEFADRNTVLTHEGETAHPDGAGNLVTDSSGEVIGSFVIPRNDVLKFATGVREFRLSDNSANNRNLETTFAEVQYHAQGLLESVQETIISTKVPKLVQTELNENRVITETEVIETTEWIDPIAETFLVQKDGGMFINSVDIFFSTKDAAIPVRLTIRTTKNGVPTQRIVPGADVILKPTTAQSGNAGEDGHIATSSNGSAKTNFKFPFPIYLAQDVEYAIVLTANTDAYNCYVAEMGQFDLTNINYRITKQPYNGVFFSSANASTWTPEQSKDLKFNIHRCEFSGSGSTFTMVNDTLPPRKLNKEPLTTTNGSATITVFHPNHGMHQANSQVIIAGAVDTNGLTASNINGTHTIANITHDSYTIDATSGTATSSGAGGGSAVTATENRHIDVFYPNISNITVPGTSLTFAATMTKGKSISGNETPYSATSALDILPNKNYKLNSPLMIGSSIQESNALTQDHSASIVATMSFDSGKSHLSPVIDMNRSSLFTIQNIVGDSGSGAEAGEAVNRGGTELARYITKVVELAEEADVATVFTDINRPTASNVLLYYRALPAGTGKDINDEDFILANPTTGSVPFNALGFTEVRYDIDPAGTFGKIQFKIVMQSTNSSTPPRIKDFRAICAT